MRRVQGYAPDSDSVDNFVRSPVHCVAVIELALGIVGKPCHYLHFMT